MTENTIDSDDKVKKYDNTSLDDFLAKFKLCGWYYMKCTILISFVLLANCINCSNYVFVAEETGYRCKDERFSNNVCNFMNSSEKCTEWIYDNPHSFVAEFQLACEEWKRTLVGTIHSLGYMIGLLIVGPLSDRIGRKKTIALTGALGGVFGTLKAFSNSYWLFVVLEFLEASLGDVGSPIFMYTVEIIDHKRRLFYRSLTGVSYSSGFTALAFAAWLVPYWRHLVLALYVPNFLFILYFWILDESPRWALSVGDNTKAIDVITKAGEIDKLKLDIEAINKISHENNKGIPFIHLLRYTITSKTLSKRLCICLCWWITSTFVNYGLQINSVSLQGNKYVNFSLFSVTEFMGLIISTFFLYRYGRRLPLACSFFFASILCLIQPFIPSNIPWLSVLIYMTGKLMSAMYFATTYLYTSEIFPTYTRNSMHALCSSIGRIGSIVAPQTPLLMVYWHGLPSVLFACASLVAALVTLMAPNTADDALPDSVHQAEVLGNKTKAKKISNLELQI